MKKRCLWMAAVALMSASVAKAQVVPSLSVDFENTTVGTKSDGTGVTPVVEGSAAFQSDRFGYALRSGPPSGYVHFPISDILRGEDGTVEMWVKPLDWSGTEQFFHVFFDARGVDNIGALYLYKFFNSGLLMLTSPEVGGPYRNAMTAIDNWQPGQWHHIAGTWSKTQQHLYIDGVKVASANPLPPSTLGSTFMLGDHPWGAVNGVSRTSSSLIDKVRVYRRLLSPQHIAAHAAENESFVMLPTASNMELKHSLNAVTRKLTAVLDSNGADITEGEPVDFQVLQNGVVRASATTSFVGSIAEAAGNSALDLSALPAGNYVLRATLRNRSLPLEKTLVLAAPVVMDLSWKGNTLGMETTVPSPWVNMNVVTLPDGNSAVTCWGREYVFGYGLLPLQVKSDGQNMLASPMKLNVVLSGQTQPLVWQNTRATVMDTSRVYGIEFSGSATASTPQGTLRVNTKTRIEYDGLATIDVSFVAPVGFNPQSVSIDIPMKTANATYRHRWTEGWEGYSGNVPAGSGVVENRSFTPFTWLGDNDRGLLWFCETGQFWPNHQSVNACETVRSTSAVTMRFNLLNGQAAPANWTYKFGIQATPVKPVRSDWRSWQITHQLGQMGTYDNKKIVWPEAVNGQWATGQGPAHKWFGYPEADNPTNFATSISTINANGCKALPYTTLTQMWAETPEWQAFEKDWNLLRSYETSGATGVNYTPGFEWVLPTNKDYSDWVTWKHDKFMRDYNFSGYYFDQVHPYQTTRTEAGGWRDSTGALQPVYPILAYRDLYRRLYRTIKAVNPNAFIMHHMSGKMGMPYLAYADAYLDGEHFRGKFVGHPELRYSDLLPLDSFRAEYMGRQWGLAPYFLPENLAPATDDSPPPTPSAQDSLEQSSGLMTMLMLHDTMPWVIWTEAAPFKTAFDNLILFGYQNATFIPYFKNPAPGAMATDMVKVSCYKRPSDGKILAIIGNLAKYDIEGDVILNTTSLGINSISSITSFDGQPLNYVDLNRKCVNVIVPKQGWRMVLITP